MKKRLTDFVRETIDISHINRADLCRGLCSVSALPKYLNQERKMDRLLLTAVLQRLGLSAVFFITLLSEEEYSYFEWRQDIAVAQLSGDWTRVQELLEDKAENPVCNAALPGKHGAEGEGTKILPACLLQCGTHEAGGDSEGRPQIL